MNRTFITLLVDLRGLGGLLEYLLPFAERNNTATELISYLERFKLLMIRKQDIFLQQLSFSFLILKLLNVSTFSHFASNFVKMMQIQQYSKTFFLKNMHKLFNLRKTR